MTEDSAPRRGRPKVAEPRTSTVSTRLSIARHDALVRRAREERVSVSEFVNRSIAQRLRKP